MLPLAVSAGLALLAALAPASGCMIVDTGDSPGEPGACAASRTIFQMQVVPMLLENPAYGGGCRLGPGGTGSCHDVNTGRSAFRLLDDADPMAPEQNYLRSLRFLNCASPGDSPILTKPLTGKVNHGGGDIIPAADEVMLVKLLTLWAGR